MLEDKYDILKYPLLLLKVCGRDPRMPWKPYLFTAGLYTITYVIFYAAVLANFFYLDGNIILFVGNCEGFATLLQIYGKVVVTTYFKNHIVRLVDTAKTWDLSGCEENTRINLEFILMTTQHTQKSFGRVFVISVLIMLTTPYFTKQFPTGIWNVTEHENLYIVILVLQEICCPLYILQAIGLDCLFLALCILVITQFRILRYQVEELKVSDVTNEIEKRKYMIKLTKCIKRHRFLLQYMQLMAKVFSPVMLLEFVSLCIVSFAEMYLIFKGDSTMHFMRGIIFLAAAMTELCFYCAPADFTTSEAAKVADAIYQSDWYSRFVPDLRNMLLIMMGRAQQQPTFTAGGLMNINMKTLITVWQFGWSVCTIMRGLQNS